MARVTGAWGRPIQGVSQQADKDRIDGQCTLQENLIPSPLNGLIKRTGTRFVKKLMESVSDKSLWYSYNRGDDEAYIVLIEPNKLPRVFDLDGVERTVNQKTNIGNYVPVPNPKKTLVMNTIADYTFILNKEKVVEKSALKAPKNPNMAILYCQYATYGRDYTVKIDGVTVANYQTPDGSRSEHALNVRTNFIAETLATQIGTTRVKTVERYAEAWPGPQGYPQGTQTYLPEAPSAVTSVINIRTGAAVTVDNISGRRLRFDDSQNITIGDYLRITYTVTNVTEFTTELHGNTVYIYKNTGESFNIETIDSASGNDLIAVQDRVQQLSNLPPHAPDGYVIKVQGKEGYDADAFWLKAVASAPEDATGSQVRWEETTAQDTLNDYLPVTMPHVLISEADGSFSFDLGEWASRKVGDDDTNPFPSFIGKTLTSVGTFQNRLIITSGESAVFSRTNNFFDFFRETTQVPVPSDPIDAFADSDEINNLIHHAVLDGDIIFFADNGQFLIQGNQPISKENIIFKKVTSYPINTVSQPAITGESIMFSFIAGKYAGVREMFTDSLTDTKRARPITEHVSEYIEGVPVDMVASPNINTLLVRTDVSKDVLYVYDWLWAGDQRVQAAMHKWTIGGSVLFAKFIQDKVYFVIQRGDGIHLEQMPIGNDADDSGLEFPVALDRRSVVAANYQNGRWEMTLPYKMMDASKLYFVRGEGCWEEDRGTSVIFETNDGVNYWTYDDLADTQTTLTCKLTAGESFVSRYIPTKPYLKDYNGRTLGMDRFTLGTAVLNYESIGLTNIIVRDKRSRREWKYQYNGRRFGGWNNRVGFAPLDAGRYEFPIRLESENSEIEIVTEDYRPFVLRDMEWSGMFKQRGRRL